MDFELVGLMEALYWVPLGADLFHCLRLENNLQGDWLYPAEPKVFVSKVCSVEGLSQVLGLGTKACQICRNAPCLRHVA